MAMNGFSSMVQIGIDNLEQMVLGLSGKVKRNSLMIIVVRTSVQVREWGPTSTVLIQSCSVYHILWLFVLFCCVISFCCLLNVAGVPGVEPRS